MLSKLCAPKITINFASSDRHQTQVDNNFDCTWAHLLLMVSALVTTSSNCCSGTRANKPAVTKWSSSSPSLLPRAPGCCNEVVKKFSFRQHSSSPSSLQLGEKVMPKARAYKWQKCKTLRNKKVTHPSCAKLTLRKISPLWRPGLPFFTSPPLEWLRENYAPSLWKVGPIQKQRKICSPRGKVPTKCCSAEISVRCIHLIEFCFIV